MNASVTSFARVLLLIGMNLSANGQGSSMVTSSSPAAQHRNPDYVAPVTEQIVAGQHDQTHNATNQVSGRRVGWFRQLLGKIHSPGDEYTRPVVYKPGPSPVSTSDDSYRAFRNQLYSTGWPGSDPLRTKWLFGRPIPADEPLPPLRP